MIRGTLNSPPTRMLRVPDSPDSTTSQRKQKKLISQVHEESIHVEQPKSEISTSHLLEPIDETVTRQQVKSQLRGLGYKDDIPEHILDDFMKELKDAYQEQMDKIISTELNKSFADMSVHRTGVVSNNKVEKLSNKNVLGNSPVRNHVGGPARLPAFSSTTSKSTPNINHGKVSNHSSQNSAQSKSKPTQANRKSLPVSTTKVTTKITNLPSLSPPKPTVTSHTSVSMKDLSSFGNASMATDTTNKNNNSSHISRVSQLKNRNLAGIKKTIDEQRKILEGFNTKPLATTTATTRTSKIIPSTNHLKTLDKTLAKTFTTSHVSPKQKNPEYTMQSDYDKYEDDFEDVDYSYCEEDFDEESVFKPNRMKVKSAEKSLAQQQQRLQARKKKHDPVSRFHQLRAVWSQDKFLKRIGDLNGVRQARMMAIGKFSLAGGGGSSSVPSSVHSSTNSLAKKSKESLIYTRNLNMSTKKEVTAKIGQRR